MVNLKFLSLLFLSMLFTSLNASHSAAEEHLSCGPPNRPSDHVCRYAIEIKKVVMINGAKAYVVGIVPREEIANYMDQQYEEDATSEMQDATSESRNYAYQELYTFRLQPKDMVTVAEGQVLILHSVPPYPSTFENTFLVEKTYKTLGDFEKMLEKKLETLKKNLANHHK